MAEPSGKLSPQLEDLRNRFEACSTHAKRLTAGLSQAQLTQRPPSGGWSVAECIAHLTLTTRAYLKSADSMLKDAPTGIGPFRPDFIGKMLAWFLEPPYRMKAKTLPAFVPGALENAESVVPEFLESQSQLIGMLERSNGLALDRIKVQSAFNEKMKYNLFSFFRILSAHQRRHLWQAEQVKSHI